MPDWLVRQYWQTAGIQTDQDYQYCCVTDKEARDEYYSSTPDGADIFTKPLAEDKFYTSWKQMCGHEPEQPEAKDDGPAPEDMDAIANRRRAKKKQRLVQLTTALWTSQACRRGNEHIKSKR
jgi:hypothetical protein